MLKGHVTGEYFEGLWMDIGTPTRLEILEKHLLSK
jgi:NDP-sugar pyrophosphorylase family protein